MGAGYDAGGRREGLRMRAQSGWAIGVWAVAFALLILGVAVSTYNIDALRANDRAVDHSRNVRRSLTELVSAVKDAETGQRGYLLTGERVYLAPYTKAETTVPERLARFQELTAGDPPRSPFLPAVQPLSRSAE